MDQTASSFLDTHPAFNRAAYAAALGHSPDDPAVEAMLVRHVQNGDIKHVAQDVYGTLPEGCSRFGKYMTDPFLVAGWLRPGAVLAYTSALDLHGYAYSITGCLAQAFALGEPCEVDTPTAFYEFLEPAPGLVLDDPAADGIETITFMDAEIRLTTLERTLADVFARPEMCCSLLDVLDFTYDDLDHAALLRHVRALGDEAAAGAMGFWLESRRDEMPVDDATLGELRALAPRQQRYALTAPRHDPTPAPGWNVILPKEIVVPMFQGMEM